MTLTMTKHRQQAAKVVALLVQTKPMQKKRASPLTLLNNVANRRLSESKKRDGELACGMAKTFALVAKLHSGSSQMRSIKSATIV